MRILAAIAAVVLAAPVWTTQPSGVTARLRGVSAVSDRVAWASGSGGTVLRTTDGGVTWQTLSIPGTEKLDFRDIDAISDQIAYVLSIGSGDSSRIFKTIDGGRTWASQFTNTDPKAFFDAMAFWDASRGVAFSDSVEGKLVILRTDNGGAKWARVPDDGLPPALENEGAFAASGTNVATYGRDHVWIGTGAAAVARVLRSTDGGRTWTRVSGLSGFRSVVAYMPGAPTPTLLAVGPQGADQSTDDGRTWTPLTGATGLHTFGFARQGRAGWGAGENGRIMRLVY